MPLNALTLSTTTGVQGRPFEAVINGLTTGRVEVLGDGSPGFSTVNGRVMSSGLPYAVSTVVLREYEPGGSPSFRDSRIDITAATGASLLAQAVASLAQGRALVRTRIAANRQNDGTFVYTLVVEDDLGATRPFLPDGTPAPTPTPGPTPTPTPTPVQFRVEHLDDGGASAGLWYGASANPAWIFDAGRNRAVGVVQRYNHNNGFPLKENTAVTYDMATRTATVAGVIMTDDGTDVGAADQHGVGTLCFDHLGFLHSYGGGHNQPMKHSVSINGGTTWRANGTMGTDTTYSHPVHVGTTQYVFFRRSPGGGTYPLVYYRSTAIDPTDGSTTFSGPTPLIEAGADARIYAGTVVLHDGLIYIPWCRANAADSIRLDAHIGVFNPADRSFRNLAGTLSRPAGTAITRAEADADFRVVNQTTGGTEETNTPAIWIDAEGLHLLYQGGVGGLTLLYARFTMAGALVEGPTAIASVTHRYATPMIGPKPGGGVEVLYPVNTGSPNSLSTRLPFDKGGSTYRVHRTAPGTWTAPLGELIRRCTPVAPYDSVTRVEGGPPDLRMVFAERAMDDNDFATGGTLRFYGWGSGGIVTTPFVEDPDAAAYIGNATFSNADRAVVTGMVRDLKRCGFWSRADGVILWGLPDVNVARRNLLNPAIVAVDTAPGNVHTPYSGFDGSATSKVTIPFNPSTTPGRRMTSTSMNLCVYPSENVQSASSDLGTTAATARLALGAQGTTGNATALLADGTPITRATGRADIPVMAERNGNTKNLYTGSKASRTTATLAPLGLPDGDITSFGNGAGFSQRGLRYEHFGAHLTGDVGPLWQAINRFAFECTGAGAS